MRPLEDLPTLADLQGAARRIAGHAVRTPLRRSKALSRRHGSDVWLKLETAQPTGAFKLRGAANALLALTPAERARGVVTYSTGNHGCALAHMARALGLRCVVCLSVLVPQAKRDRLSALGAELVVGGADQDTAMAEALRLVTTQGLHLVPPFDDPRVIAGQGTIVLEIAEDLPDVATVIVPVSGGGLLGGIAIGLQALCPRAHLVAVTSAACPAMRDSLEAGRPIAVTERPSLADSLGGGIGLDNRFTFRLAQRGIDTHLTVDEPMIAAAMRRAFRDERLVLEGAAAVGIAALEKLSGRPGPVVLVITGNTVGPAQFRAVIDAEP